MEAIEKVKHMLKIAAGAGPCLECGLKYNRSSPAAGRRHRRYHDEMLCGVKIERWEVTERLPVSGRMEVARVTRLSLKREISLAEHVAIVANRRPHFDLHHFGPDLFTYDPDAFCLLAVAPDAWPRCRVVGIAVFRSLRRIASSCWSEFVRMESDPALWRPSVEPSWHSEPDNSVEPDSTQLTAAFLAERARQYIAPRRPMGLLFAWVATQHRRQGVARLLIEVAATACRQEPTQFPLVPPLTDDARAAAITLFPETVEIGEPVWTENYEPRRWH